MEMTCVLGVAVRLRNDGVTSPYTQFNRAFGGTAYEVPDCGHTSFGLHITHHTDVTLNRPVFNFNIHKTPDDDRCTNFDRQRNEVKTYEPSPTYLKGYSGATVTFSWNFRLDANFQPSTSFTHVHQIKFVGGDDSLPAITITPRKQSPEDSMQLIYINSAGVTTVISNLPLAPYKGVWVHVWEKITYGSNGKYEIAITRTSNGTPLMSYRNDNIDMWRKDTSFGRPKWGIYRSLANPGDLRDEQVRFDDFCLAKGSDTCDT